MWGLRVQGLNLFKGGYIADHIGEYHKDYLGGY